MSKRDIKHPEKQVSTGAYSAGVLVDGWLYVSGQASLDYRTGRIIRGTVEEETRCTLEHIEKILHAAGATIPDIVKCTVHLHDIREFDRFNQAYFDFFAARGATILPARTTVQSVLYDDLKVEIDAVARVKG